MKNLLIATSFLVLISCGKTSEHSHHEAEGTAGGEDPNKALYDQVMDIHDEVMPKMQDLYALKLELLEKIAQSPNMPTLKKEELEQVISSLDSTSNAMMDWMHNFSPLPDSTNQEVAREYLETEMQKIQRVKALTNETIDRAKAAKEKN